MKPITIITKDKYASLENKKNFMSRSSEHLAYSKSSGILMLDYDPEPETKPLQREELTNRLFQIAPAVKSAPLLWRQSASSNLYNAKTGELIQGIAGQRFYILVERATDIPKIGKALHMLSWSHGYGYIKISRAGSLLERGLFDSSVFQAERLDYAGPPVCIEPIEQRRDTSVVMNVDAPPLKFVALGVKI
jgi:hypothetical protein